MDSPSPFPAGPGQRMLAAIVFTDVKGFSARMQVDEEATLHLLERDFTVMRELAEKHGGSVLKTTGDGLMLYFTSAVQAVTYARTMQRHFAATAKEELADEILTHRVGIHLGDVFVNEQDVMGDGVNIAARLQAQAEPGGICISQTVYDVVKNKLELDVVRLGHRELKNISEAIPMYRLLLEPPKPGTAGSGQAMKVLPPPPPPAFSLTRTQRVAAGILLVLVLAAVAGLVMKSQQEREAALARSKATQDKIGALTARADDIPGKPAAGESGGGNPDRPQEYDFAEMTRDQPAEKSGIAKGDPQVQQQATERLQALLRWMDAAMPRYTKDRPLLVREPPGTVSSETKVFAGADHRVYFAEGGAIRQRNWTDLKPANLGLVIVSVLLDSPVAPPREVVQGAEAFAYLYGLPEINASLHAGHLGGAQK